MWDVAILTAKVMGGTALFVAILLTARAGSARVAGLMLTFPTLNGLGLLGATQQDLGVVVNAMLPVIALNGLLCVGYIWLFQRGANALLQSGIRVAIVCGLVWLLAACLLVWLDRPDLNKLIAITYAVGAVVFTFLRWSPRAAPEAPESATGTLTFLNRRRDRVLLFALSLAVVLAIAHRYRDAGAWVGVLSALPVLPLFVLAGIAEDRPRQFGVIRDIVAIGPAIAMVFALGYAWFLAEIRHPLSDLDPFYWAAGILGLLAGWGLHGFIVYLLARPATAAAGVR